MLKAIFIDHNGGSATLEILGMLLVMFILGYTLGRLKSNKKRLSKNASRYERRMQQLDGVHRS